MTLFGQFQDEERWKETKEEVCEVAHVLLVMESTGFSNENVIGQLDLHSPWLSSRQFSWDTTATEYAESPQYVRKTIVVAVVVTQILLIRFP